MAENTALNNRYMLQNRLGSGGMAVVYKARDLMLERTVAIKVLRRDFSENPDFRERFRQEAMAAANLSHPNIVTVHDFGLDAGRLFIVMEHVPGSDLKTIIKQQNHLSVDETVHLIVQACAGIGYAHRAGLVHCDVKPHNLLVTPDKRVKVTDFGIARAFAFTKREEPSSVVWGSPQYFSPEQASGEAPIPASDVYGLGVILYEMLTGQLPFVGKTGSELARLHREEEPLSPSRLNATIPDVLEQIILKILSKEPSSRYRTADQLGRVLLNIQPKINDGSPELEIALNEPGNEILVSDRDEVDYPERPVEILQSQKDYLDIDWISVALGLLAILAVGGLIPFWIWIYFLYNPPLR